MALKNTKERNDIIITHADKGGALVIIDILDYLKEADRQLKDTNFYTTLDHNPTEKHTEIINETIKTFMKEKLLNEQLGKNLIEHNPKTPNLYFRPKIHKTDTPGRPIVSSIHSHSSRISEFVDIQLEPIVNNIKSHIKDTIDFINKIETIQNIPKDTILVTMDVKSLFTQIPHTEGINAVARAIENAKNTKISNRVILKLLSLTLHLNNFEFNGKHYLQKKGSSMGSKSSCRYADIFMDDFETKYIYPRISGKHLAYYRFVDDIFMVWNDSKENLITFFKDINTVHESIKFDCVYSHQKINFLDTTVFKNAQHSLSTKVYTKPTDRPGYIYKTSYHPKSQINNIPYGQSLRLKRICTEETDLDQAIQNLKEGFEKRGYKETQLEEQFKKIQHVNRKDLLVYKESKVDNTIKFTTKYNRNLPDVRRVIHDNWNILSTNNKLGKIFADKPILTFKRNKNLKDLIGGNKLLNNQKIIKKVSKTGHCSSCLSQIGNICCKHIVSTSNFNSASTGETFAIKHHVNCKTKKGIYLASCKLCPKHQYVEKFETPWNERLYNHRKDAKKKNLFRMMNTSRNQGKTLPNMHDL